MSTTNALTEENEYLRKVLKQHDIELALAPASEQKQ
nr:MAG TPA: ion-channel membrane-localization domain protein [Caudoviricetes sp.]